MAEVIVALDVPEPRVATAFLDAVPRLEWVKVGPTLFLTGGPELIRDLKGRGLRVFLDLKWHDIPHQVVGAVRAAAGLGVDLATVHALGGREMLRAAVAEAGGMRLAAVSVLTSHSPAGYGAAVGRGDAVDLGAEVERLVSEAVAAGVGAVVCSADEARRVRGIAPPGTWLVVPGIRMGAVGSDDQARTADPAAAVRAGATHLVVGRPIVRAENPERVYAQLCELAK